MSVRTVFPFPVTAVAPDADPRGDSFALDEVGSVLLAALHEWARECLPRATWGASPTPSSGSPRTSSRRRARTSPTRWRAGRCLAQTEAVWAGLAAASSAANTMGAAVWYPIHTSPPALLPCHASRAPARADNTQPLS